MILLILAGLMLSEGAVDTCSIRQVVEGRTLHNEGIGNLLSDIWRIKGSAEWKYGQGIRLPRSWAHACRCSDPVSVEIRSQLQNQKARTRSHFVSSISIKSRFCAHSAFVPLMVNLRTPLTSMFTSTGKSPRCNLTV